MTKSGGRSPRSKFWGGGTCAPVLPVIYAHGFSQARSYYTTVLSGCNQPHEAYNLVGLHQMAPLSTRKQAYYLFIDPGRMKG